MAALLRLPLFVLIAALTGLSMLLPAAYASVHNNDEMARTFLYSGLLVLVHGDAAAVIRDADVIIRQESHLDAVGMSAHRFVSRVIKNFPNEVVETIGIGGADVHARALTNRFQTL